MYQCYFNSIQILLNKAAILFICLAFSCLPLFMEGQPFMEHNINSASNLGTDVHATDLDGDGDIDILGTFSQGGSIKWWENDGSENFTVHTIGFSFGAEEVFTSDLDGDGDIDVLSADSHMHDILWWENDGNENFTKHTIDGSFFGAYSVYATDVNGDGHMDVLGAAVMANDITWWENDGNENFTKHIIDDSFSGAWSVYATDVNGDGNMDVLGTARSAHDITWWENDGNENFTEHTINGDFNGAISVYATDVNGDGNMDVLGAAFSADDITWWENDGNENFTEHTINGDFNGAKSVYATDVNGDGHVDVLGAAEQANDITWWENDGNENFTEHTINGDFLRAWSVSSADINGDGNMDILGAALTGAKITWWENVPPASPFITTWETTDPDESITIPTTGSGYDYQVDWGDGQTSSNQTGNATHIYSTAGTYTVKVSGDFPRIFFNNSGDKDKIKTIESWGDIEWTSMNSAFFGASNLTCNATDTPDLSAVTDMAVMFTNASSFDGDLSGWDVSKVNNMSSLFSGATAFNGNISNWEVGNVTNMNQMFILASSFNGDLSEWDVSNVDNMHSMFTAASSFDQDLGDWDISSVTEMSNMLTNTALSIINYDKTLIGWESQSIEDITLGASGLKYCLADPARNNLLNTLGWTINGDSKDCSPFFITTWQITSNNESITIPTTGSGYNYEVYWGDGQSSYNQTGSSTHIYATPGTYTITISGVFPRIYFNNTDDKDKIMSIENWGNIAWTSMEKAFYGASNLTYNASDSPDLSNVTVTSYMFQDATSFNGDISGWDVSNVMNMRNMFQNATSFNQNLNAWNVSSVNNMRNMFQGASSFNKNLSGWNVNSVSTMRNMFQNATTFNKDLSTWDVSNVSNMFIMFKGASSFNRNLGGWNISSVTNMTEMLDNSGLSRDNYDNTLIGWESQGVSNITLGAADLEYCNGETARTSLMNTYGWNISGDNLDCSSALDFDGNNDYVEVPDDDALDFNSTDAFTLECWIYYEGTNSVSGNGQMLMVKRDPSSTTNYQFDINESNNLLRFNSTANSGILNSTAITEDVWTHVAVVYDNAAVTFYVNGAPDGTGAHTIDASNSGPLTLGYDPVANKNAFFGKMDEARIWNRALSASELASIYDDSFLDPTSPASCLVAYYKFEEGSGTFTADATGNGHDGTLKNMAATAWVNSGAGTTPQLAPSCPTPFVTTWQTTNNNESITIPTTGSGYDYHVDWGDGQSSSNQTGNVTHSYANPGTYTVSISGIFPRIYFNNSGDKQKIKTIEQWGSIVWASMESAFSGTSNLTYNATDAPNLSAVQNMSYMFQHASQFDGDLSNWNVTNVTNMNRVFDNASQFNGNISTWNVMNVTEMEAMFNKAGQFNGDISAWNVGKVTNMNFMFREASQFDGDLSTWNVGEVMSMNRMFDFASQFTGGDLSAWNVSKVTDMEAMFNKASQFNGNISAWNVSMVTNMGFMFREGSLFNGDISAWEVGAVTDMNRMFEQASQFVGGDLSAWDVSKVTDMTAMFIEASLFNGNISTWDVDMVTNMSFMFKNASQFNGDLSGWNVDMVDNMSAMFQGASQFNSDLSTWSVGNVTNMAAMFYAADQFDQNLGSWTPSDGTNMINMLSNSGLSITNYDNTLIGWESQGVSNINLGAAGLEYCLGETARTSLIDNFTWIISGDAKLCPCNLSINSITETDDCGTGNGTITVIATCSVCSSLEYSIDGTDFSNTSGIFTNVVIGSYTVTVRDAGSPVSCIETGLANITADDESPIAACQNITVQLDNNCTYTLSPTDLQTFGAGSIDNCTTFANLIFSASPSSFDNNDNGIAKLVTLTVADANGNENTCTANVTVTDNAPPTAMCNNFTVQLDESGAYFLTSSDLETIGAGSTDNCWASPYLYFSASSNNFSCEDLDAAVDITLTVTDENGNVASCIAEITVEDNVDPNPQCSNIAVTLDETGTYTLSVNDLQNIGTGSDDNCGAGNLTFSASPNGFDCDDLDAPVTITLTVTDASSNEATCTADITVQDIYDPTPMCNDIIIGLEPDGFYTLSQNDLLSIGAGSTDNCGAGNLTFGVSPNSFNCGDLGSPVTITLTVADQNNNEAICHALITVEDNVPPIPSCANTTVTLDHNGVYTLSQNNLINIGISSLDNCTASANLTLSASPNSFDCDNLGTPVSTTITIADASGNESTCIVDITVEDDDSPEAVCSNISVELDENGGYTLSQTDLQTIGAASTDNCGNANLTFSASPNSFNCSNLGSSNYGTLTVSDESGNTRTCVSTITVLDNSAPTPICNNISVALESNGTYTLSQTDLENIGAGSTDNCSAFANLTLSASPNSFNCGDLAAPVIITLTVTDENSNTTTCTAAITVEDNESPTPMCNNITVDLEPNGSYALSQTDLEIIGAGSTDNCSAFANLTFSASPNSFNCDDLAAPVVITLTVTDESSNEDNCTANVTVNQGTGSCSPFITNWLTTSPNESITIPTIGSGYDYYVDWGDGQSSSNQTGDASHIFANPGTYTIAISGSFPRIYFNNSGDKDKIKTIEQWGDNVWTSSMEGAFYGASNLIYNATDAPNLSNVTSLRSMFKGANSFNGAIGNWDVSNITNMIALFDNATSFNQDIGDWDVSKVTNMNNLFNFATSFNQDISDWVVSEVTSMNLMFRGASSFNQDLSSWNVSKVTGMSRLFDDATSFNGNISGWDVGMVQNMRKMFLNATAFNQNLGAWDLSSVTIMTYMLDNSGLSINNYDNTLIGWESQGIEDITLGASGLEYCLAEPARNNLLNTLGWTINGDSKDCSPFFITTWQTTSPNESITIPTIGVGYDYEVIWGDGQCSSNQMGNATHIYAIPGTYTVAISGTFPQIYFNNSGDKDKIRSIEHWGDNVWTSMHSAFYGASNLTYNATNVPNLSEVTNMSNLFNGAGSFNGNLSGWDVSSVTSMSSMFREATSFNGDLSGWNVSNVTDMSWMFLRATSFNSDLSGWNVSSVTDMSLMFREATSFNSDLSGWNVSSLTNMSQMFSKATSFNGNLSDWDVSSATDMSQMFFEATSFNRDLSNWDVSSVTDMTQMLSNTALSLINYDNTLIGWEAQGISNITLGATGLDYCLGETARTSLIDNFGWDISGDNINCPVPVITAQPMSMTKCPGESITFSITATGNNPTYQWKKNGSNIVNATNSTLTINNLQSVDAGEYTCEVSNIYGSVISNVASLTMDIVKPIINNCPDNIAQAMDAGQCGATISWTAPTATDNCDTNPTILQTTGTASGSLFMAGTETIKYTATDEAGNVSLECAFTVTISGDMEKPVLNNCPDNISQAMDAGQCGATISWTAPTATDNCDANPTVLQSAGANSGTFFEEGIETIKYQTTDAAGNASTECVFTVTVLPDAEKPVLNNCPDNISQAMDAGQCGATISWTAPNATDNCDMNLTVVQTAGADSGTLFEEGIETIKYQTTDAAGNASMECVFTVTVLPDAEKPVLNNCPDNLSQAMDAGQCGATISWTAPNATDNCDVNPTVLQTIGTSNGNFFAAGTETIKYTATDDAGNESLECIFTVTISGDVEKPILKNCPSNISQGMDAGQCGATISWILPTVMDNCDANPSLMQTAGLASNSFFEEGTQTISYQATDAAGNESLECSFTVTIMDNTDPIAICQNQTIALDINGHASITPDDIDNGSSDPCGISLGLSQTNFNCNHVGGNTVTLTVTDTYSNTTTCNATVTVQDNIAPNPQCQNVSIQLDINGEASTNAAAIDNGSWDACGVSLALSQTNFDCAHVGDNTVTLTVTDDNSNSSSCTATVTVEALTTMTINDVTKSEGNPTGFNAYIFQVTRSDAACAIDFNYATQDGSATLADNDFVFKSNTLSFPKGGSLTRTISVNAVKDDKVEADEVFTVLLSNVSNTIASYDSEGTATLLNDDSALLSISDASGTEGAGAFAFDVTLIGSVAGGFSIDYSTQDGTAGSGDYTSNNGTLNFAGTSGEVQTINIAINDDNIVELTEDFFVNIFNVQGASITITDDQGEGMITDNDAASISITDVSMMEGDNGTKDYIFTATLSGNVEAAFTIDFATQDNTAEDETGDGDYTSNAGILNFAGMDGETQNIIVTVNGDCQVEGDEDFTVNLSNIQAGGRNITFSNAQGIGSITGDDDLPSINTCASDFTASADISCGYKLLDYTGMASASGGCGSITLSQSPTSGTTVGLGVSIITITATDGASNQVSCDFEITVEDNTAPTALCQDISITLPGSGQMSITAAQINAGSSDNCNLVSTTLNQTNFDCSHIGTNTVTLTAEDTNNLTDACTATVTVVGVQVTCYLDSDGDEYGNANQSQSFCFSCGTGYVMDNSDCDDTNASLNPGITEICDGIDNNCDGNIDEGFDADGDGYTICNGDCDDTNAALNPGIAEICDGIDNNCDGQIDEGFDMDGDGFTTCNGDCDDNDITINPNAAELCDGIDNNCDGNIDEGFDADGDGYTICSGDCNDANAAIHPGATEICDGLDNDCNGLIDDGTSGTFTGDVVLLSQAEVDAFSSCINIIDGNLIINGANITNLTGLSNLVEVTQDVSISNTSLSGFGGLGNLAAIGGSLNISANALLQDVTGFSSLTTLGSSLNITQNISLFDLIGLEGLTNVSGDLGIIQNVGLVSLEGLDNINTVSGNLTILVNPILTDCCPIYNLLNGGVTGMSLVFGNNTGCESVPAVNTACAPALPLLLPSNTNCQECPAEMASEISHETYQTIEVYPNPAQGAFYLQIKAPFEKGTVELRDISGKVILRKELNDYSSQYQIGVEDLRSGMYVLIANLDGRLKTEKVFIQ